MRCKRQSNIIKVYCTLKVLFFKQEIGAKNGKLAGPLRAIQPERVWDAAFESSMQNSTMPTFCTVCRLDSRSFCEVLLTI